MKTLNKDALMFAPSGIRSHPLQIEIKDIPSLPSNRPTNKQGMKING